MKKLLAISLLLTSSFSYASDLDNLSSDSQNIAAPSVKQTLNKLTKIPPVDNATITVFANSVGGPVKKLTTNSCMQVVELIKPLIGNKPMLIMDGGYTLQIQQNDKTFQLSSQQEILFSWIKRCENLQ